MPAARRRSGRQLRHGATLRAWPAAAAATVAAAVAVLCVPAAAQQVTPLKGQGSPLPETRDLFVSVYLDRLLGVNDRDYRFKAAFQFYLTWNDSQAYFTVQNNTERWRRGEIQCRRQCTDWGDDLACCDGIWLPSIYIRNVYRYSQDRATGYKIFALPPPYGSVLWSQVVQAEFYQPMSLRSFPFDSWDLLAFFEFMDTSTAGHPGLRMHMSAAGPRIFTMGQGDDASDWQVDGIQLSTTSSSLDSTSAFKLGVPGSVTTVASHPQDPLPFSEGWPVQLVRGLVPGQCDTRRANPVNLGFIKVRITRFSSYHVLTDILPVALVGYVSFVCFFLPRRELSSRLGVIVTLFLTAAAIQFVISGSQPASSYVMPTQAQTIATYCLLALIAVEAVLAWHLERYQETTEEAHRRSLAHTRWLSGHSPAMQAAAAAAVCEADQAAAAEVATADKEAAAAAGDGGGRRGSVPCSCWAWPCGRCPAGGVHPCRGDGGGGGRQAPPKAPPGRTLSSLGRLRAELRRDPALGAFWAARIERWCLAALLVGYTVATALIFALTAGYVDLFPAFQ